MIGALAVLAMTQTIATPPPPVPFAVGEAFEYTGRWGFLHVPVAHARLAVDAVDTVRGVPVWRFAFVGHATILHLYTSNDTLTSWTAIDPFESLRFEKRVNDTAGTATTISASIWTPASSQCRRLGVAVDVAASAR